MMKGMSLVEYMRLGRHKCSPSPTGAHHWCIGEANQLPGTPQDQWVCKYCGEARRDFTEKAPRLLMAGD